MKHKILIVDDSIVNINALYVMLKDQYQVYVAKNGPDGIKQAKSMSISLILLDILMPEMDGFEVLNLLMKDPKTKGIPVMFITSLSDEKNEEKGLNLGAVDYLVKPFNPSVIKAKVKNHIELFEYRKTIENIAMLDGLTGVPNRRSYNDKIIEFWNKARQQNRTLSVAILDIDCFKEYNDNYGHLQGDQVLKRVALQLKQLLPTKGGFLGRYGGEEFVILLYGYEQQDALDILEGMRRCIEDLGIEHIHSRAKNVITVSVGGGSIVPDTSEIDQFIELVDKRLYLAKGLGRNRTIWEDIDESKGQIEVFMFGVMRILAKDGIYAATRHKKQKIWSLLAFLIANRYKEYTKEMLYTSIWPYGEVTDPDYEVKGILEELREELTVLKVPYLQELIITMNGTYHWNNAYMCIVDSELFENLYHEAMAVRDEEKEYELCERALQLYKEDYLYMQTTAQWIREKRTEYYKIYRLLLGKLVHLCYERQQYKNIVRLCQRELYKDQIDEQMHYYYIKSLIHLGRKREALDHFEYIVEAYYRILKRAPEEKITSLYAEIVEENKEGKCSLKEFETLLNENSIAIGAYYCDLHVFKNIYQIEARNMTRTGNLVYLCVVNMTYTTYLEEKKKEECSKKMQQSIKKNLRIGDIFCKVNERQYAILFPAAKYELASVVVERVLSHFLETNGEEECSISYELVPVIKAETIERDIAK